jgi:thymidine phosphorylase
MLSIASSMGVAATAFHTAMDRPLGAAVGHALEIVESLACLSGGGPADLRELVLLQGGEMLRLAGAASSLDDGRRRIAEALDSGRARRVFELAVREQGGDPRVVADPAMLPRAPAVDPWRADRAGFLAFRDLRDVGWAVAELGGGRTRIEDVIDPAVGLVWRKQAGERVEKGDLLCEIHHARGHGLDACRARLAATVVLGERADPVPLVRATWHA